MNIKKGDIVGVRVAEVDYGDQTARIEGPYGDRWVDLSVIYPLPPALTPEAQAVLDAADAVVGDETSDVWDDACKPFYRAVLAYRASLNPADPVDGLIALLESSGVLSAEMRDAIAKVRAARSAGQ